MDNNEEISENNHIYISINDVYGTYNNIQIRLLKNNKLLSKESIFALKATIILLTG